MFYLKLCTLHFPNTNWYKLNPYQTIYIYDLLADCLILQDQHISSYYRYVCIVTRQQSFNVWKHPLDELHSVTHKRRTNGRLLYWFLYLVPRKTVRHSTSASWLTCCNTVMTFAPTRIYLIVYWYNLLCYMHSAFVKILYLTDHGFEVEVWRVLLSHLISILDMLKLVSSV